MVPNRNDSNDVIWSPFYITCTPVHVTVSRNFQRRGGVRLKSCFSKSGLHAPEGGYNPYMKDKDKENYRKIKAMIPKAVIRELRDAIEAEEFEQFREEWNAPEDATIDSA